MTELERKLIERIESEGPITFRDFMQAALYDSTLGYYNTERLKIGPAGDYYTSSNVHPAFGQALAQSFIALWKELSVDGPLTIIEIGAGTGQLAADVLAAMREEHSDAFHELSYVIIESSKAMQARQKEKLAPFGERVKWRELEELELAPATAVAFSNELVDAMPVHRVRLAGGQIEEQYVTTGQGSEAGEKQLSIIWSKPCTPKLSDYIERLDIRLAENQLIEINLDAVEWFRRMAKAMERGFLITIDYGDLSAHLYGADRIHGTLRSFYKHRLIDSPLERVGEQDITASVNFTALIEYGRDFGFETISYERQTGFLIRNGLIERIAATHDESGSLDDLNERLAIKNLFVPGGISDNFRVLIQSRRQGGKG